MLDLTRSQTIWPGETGARLGLNSLAGLLKYPFSKPLKREEMNAGDARDLARAPANGGQEGEGGLSCSLRPAGGGWCWSDASLLAWPSVRCDSAPLFSLDCFKELSFRPAIVLNCWVFVVVEDGTRVALNTGLACAALPRGGPRSAEVRWSGGRSK